MQNSKTSTRTIELKGVKVNNLKNISLSLPTNKLIVVTGLSGSGKSSLVFDTLYAEGQRRYVESLSSYARQFLGRMSKPEVDSIEGISPAIAIEQKTISKNPRSTVGTVTEIYEYLKLMFARIGKIYSPISGKEVKRHSVSNVSDFIYNLPTNTKAYILSPINIPSHLSCDDYKKLLLQMGFSRLYVNGEIISIQDAKITKQGECLLIDRLIIRDKEQSLYSRIFDSVQTSFNEGDGECIIEYIVKNTTHRKIFSNKLEADGIKFIKPSPNFFSFNNPYGACKTCQGLGNINDYSEDLVIPNKNISVYENCVAIWRGEKMSEWKVDFINNASKINFPFHKPYNQLSKEEKEILWGGNNKINGIYKCFEFIEGQSFKLQYRVLASRYKSKTVCRGCNGNRIREDANYVKINGKSISDLINLSIAELYNFFSNIVLNETEREISLRMLTEIKNRLSYLIKVGLPYLTFNRTSSTLSGGEAQRIHLANSLGSTLIGSMYILDEPSIGLHPRDTEKLIAVIKQLRDLGNTVIVVEHDEEIMRQADYIVDIGPMAGQFGGEVIFSGSPKEMIEKSNTLTAKYLRGECKIEIPKTRRALSNFIELNNANLNNLKNISVKIPINALTVVTGVSGSGKTSLIRHTLYSALQNKIGHNYNYINYESLKGDVALIGGVELVDQNPIGKSARSNPITYIKAYDYIRTLFASQALAKKRSYPPGYFSFNVDGGRCPNCLGEGSVNIEMQFMAAINLECEECHGKRFKSEILEVQYMGENIADILNMSIDEAIAFFTNTDNDKNAGAILERLNILRDVGLGYLQLGQSSNSLSGGEAQRIKLAFFLCKGSTTTPTLFIFDEPTTGLHFHDINKLQEAFNALIKNGHTIVVIEHNLDIIKLADYIIDIGKEGGELGGNLIFEGRPEKLINIKNSYTAEYLKRKF